MRVRRMAAAMAVAMSLGTPAAAAPRPSPPVALGEFSREFSVDELDEAALVARAQYELLARHLAENDLGSIEVPSLAEIRSDLDAAVATAITGAAAPGFAGPAIEDEIGDPNDLLDDSRDTDTYAETSGSDLLSHCSFTLKGYGKGIWGWKYVQRYVYLETVNSCTGRIVLSCLTKAWTLSNFPLMVGLGFAGSSGGCFTKTNRSGFTTRPAAVVGVQTIVISEPFAVRTAPFTILI